MEKYDTPIIVIMIMIATIVASFILGVQITTKQMIYNAIENDCAAYDSKSGDFFWKKSK